MITAKLFKKIVREDNGDYKNNFELLKKGILVEKPVTDRQKYELIKLYGIDVANINSTFYKTFDEVNSYTFEEREFLQIIHYLSTYGEVEELQNHGEIFEPLGLNEELLKEVTPVLTAIKVVDSYNDLKDDIEKLLSKGIALNSKEVDELGNLIYNNSIDIDINKIKNKEILVILSSLLEIPPKDADMFANVIHYLATEKSLYIKDKKVLTEELGYDIKDVELISKMFERYKKSYGLDELIKNYRPHKYLYLILRKYVALYDEKYSKPIRKIINKISYENKTYNKPRNNDVPLNLDLKDDEINKLLSSMNLFQLVKMYNSAKERFYIEDNDIQVYKIRNGKTYAKEIDSYDKEDKRRYMNYIIKIEETLRNRYKDYFKDVNLVIPENIELAMPTTLKNSIGNIPNYSYIELPKGENLKIGISWDIESDIDIHGHSVSGEHVGFYGRGSNGFVHSGDMTSLNQYGYAAEYFLVDKDIEDNFMFSATKYSNRSGIEPLPFKVIVARDTGIKDDKKIIDPKDIIFFSEMKFEEERNMNLGIIVKDKNPKFIFNKSSQFRRIPDDNINSRMIEPILRKSESAMTLKEFLDIIEYKEKEDIDKFIDLRKTNIIDFLKEID